MLGIVKLWFTGDVDMDWIINERNRYTNLLSFLNQGSIMLFQVIAAQFSPFLGL